MGDSSNSLGAQVPVEAAGEEREVVGDNVDGRRAADVGGERGAAHGQDACSPAVDQGDDGNTKDAAAARPNNGDAESVTHVLTPNTPAAESASPAPAAAAASEREAQPVDASEPAAAAPAAAQPDVRARQRPRVARTEPSPEPADTAAAPSVSARAQLEAAIEKDPRSAENWTALLDLVLSAQDLAETRTVYDRFFEFFPNAAAQWIAYAELELAHSHFQEVDTIFTRCLRTTMSVELWKFYLSYTRRVNPLPPYTNEDDSPRDQTRRVLEEAYEFSLKYIGWDRDSGSIWQDYINLVREREARGTWQEGQKMDQLRRIFQRAVTVPLNFVEAIWRDYDAYENSLNKVTAKKFLAERSPAYMQARTMLRELKQHTDPLVRPALPLEPLSVLPTTPATGGSAALPRTPAKERHALQLWRRYLTWEEKNPLMLEDAALLQSRVQSAYKKAVMCVRFDAVVWYMAATYCQAQHRESDALWWYKSGTEACPWSLLLCFGYAELCRAQGRYADAVTALDGLVAYTQTQIDRRLDALHAACRAVDADVDAERKRVREQFEQQDAAPGEERDAAELVDMERHLHERRVQRKGALEDEAQADVNEWKDNLAQVWIRYMHFVRCAEGIRPTRQVFGRARKTKHCSWPVYEANALLEYHCSKEQGIATKVFELALKTFGNDPHLVVRYLDFLIATNDDANARAVLERTVSGLTPQQARPIWDRWAEYEFCFGDASAVSRLTARLGELYPDESRVEVAAGRLRYRTLDAVRGRELGHSHALACAARRLPAAAPAVVSLVDEDEDDASESRASTPVAAAAGRQSMEEIRKSILGGSTDVGRRDTEKRGWGPKQETVPPSKKAKHAADTPPARRSVAREAPSAVPEAILYFMGYLPNAAVFDGPRISPDNIFECLLHSNMPAPKMPAPRKAIWVKYPNPYTDHVRSVDVLERRICPQTGRVYTERVMALQQNVPQWIKKQLVGVKDETYVRETVTVDPQTQSVHMASNNLSFAEYFEVRERVQYSPCAENGSAAALSGACTRFDQTADFVCCGLRGSSKLLASAAGRVEDASCSRFRDNAHLGRAGFVHVLQRLYPDTPQADPPPFEPHAIHAE
ncbi:mRNA 3'-end-processing protein rna14 [Malassezia sp. CBS 17886]|nr:mRNA 3'-end-processing protein rna14 [Malassezia sp. CBS 17886]